MENRKIGIINWNPSKKTMTLARKIHKMKERMTWDQIVVKTGYSRVYLINLNNMLKKLKGETK